MNHDIIIYSTPTCSWCQAAKDYLYAREIEFDDVDVSSDMVRAMEMVEKSGQQGVPVIDIDGEIIVGFDRPQIDSLLDLN
jgi:glutaredoxin-like YruB-family protein